MRHAISLVPNSANIPASAAFPLSRILMLGVAIPAALAMPATALALDVPSGTTQPVGSQGDVGLPNGTTTVQDGGTLEITGNTVIVQNLYTVSGNGDGGAGAIHNSSGNNTLSGDIEVNDTTSIISSAGLLTLEGAITSPTPVDLELTLGGAGNILYTGDMTLGSAGQSYSIQKTGTGTLTLTGQNNSYTGYFNVEGGTLQISNGGKTTITGSVDNDAVFVNGNLVVTGLGSTLTLVDHGNTVNNYLVVGRQTAAPTSVTVNGGGQLNTTAAVIGEGKIPSGAQSIQITATVDGAGSVWDFGESVYVGAAAGGSADLTISNGGVMTTSVGGGVAIGAAGDGTATVTDAGSTLKAGGLKVGLFHNGEGGTGELTVTNGGLVDAQSVEIGTETTGIMTVNSGSTVVSGSGSIGSGASGTATVTGAGARWESGSFLGIGQDVAGGAAGQGALSIQNGGFVSADIIFVGLKNNGVGGSSGSLTVQGMSVVETTSLMKGFESASALFDGGILRATGNDGDNLYGSPFIGAFDGTFTIDIGDDGMFIDTQAFDVTGGAVLADDDALNPGFLVKQGTGRLVLTADNTYSAGTTITDGILQLGAGGTSGWIVRDVTNNGVLAFNRSDMKTFDGTITGTGGVHQIGTGTTILTANSSGLSGISQVQAGILSVNGTLGGNMEVIGGRLQGIGQVGGTTNFIGGTIAPGNSIGTLTVAGNYVGNGGTLEIETVLGDDSSATDQIGRDRRYLRQHQCAGD